MANTGLARRNACEPMLVAHAVIVVFDQPFKIRIAGMNVVLPYHNGIERPAQGFGDFGGHQTRGKSSWEICE